MGAGARCVELPSTIWENARPPTRHRLGSTWPRCPVGRRGSRSDLQDRLPDDVKTRVLSPGTPRMFTTRLPGPRARQVFRRQAELPPWPGERSRRCPDQLRLSLPRGRPGTWSARPGSLHAIDGRIGSTPSFTGLVRHCSIGQRRVEFEIEKLPSVPSSPGRTTTMRDLDPAITSRSRGRPRGAPSETVRSKSAESEVPPSRRHELTPPGTSLR